MKRLVVVHPDPDTLAAATAARLVTAILDAQSLHTPVHVVLTGGTVGIKTLAKVRDLEAARAVDWSSVHLWWGDERFLPDGDPDRNETQAREALIDYIDIPAANVHAVPAESDDVPTAEDAARRYSEALGEFSGVGEAVPDFDVLLLGMGPDGHVASLFPGFPQLRAGGVAVAVHDSPKPPPTRVSLTYASIYSARDVWVVCSGAEKAEAAARALSGADVHEIPAAGAHGSERTLWLIDSAAAKGAPDLTA